MSELKKCPACGGEAEFSKYHAVCNYLIICNNCEIMQMGMDECKVLEAWNNQPRIEQLKQRTKELEQALKMSKCKFDTVEIAEIYVSEGESVISGTPIFKDTDGKVYYSNVLSTISKIVAEVGDKVSKGTDIFYGTGGE